MKKRPFPQGKLIAQFVEGNAVGKVEEFGDNRLVKIGVLESKAPCSAREFQAVIRQLQQFLKPGKPKT